MVHQHHLQLLQPRRKRRSNSRKLRPRRRNKKRQLKRKEGATVENFDQGEETRSG